MKKIIVGMIKGRHELPVEDYIFDVVENVHDYDAIHAHVMDFLKSRVGLTTTYGCGINQVDYADVEILCGKSELVVYVTGLTCVTAELIRCCAMYGVSLTLMHYDNATGSYMPQKIF